MLTIILSIVALGTTRGEWIRLVEMHTEPTIDNVFAADESTRETVHSSAADNRQHADSDFPLALFITWTTYGSWLSGDIRGWRKWKRGQRPPQPHLENWCRDRLSEQPVLLNQAQRQLVEHVLQEHAHVRGWLIHASSVRSNHVHIVVTAAAIPRIVRDQFKANSTRVLRAPPFQIVNKKVWSKGGDIQFIDTQQDLEQVDLYVTEAQGRMDRGK